MHRTFAWVTSITFAATATASSALADPVDAGHVERFSSLDRADGGTDAGADLAFVLTDDDSVGGFATRLDLHGEYLHPSGFGGYAALGVSRTFLSADDPGASNFVDAINDETALTNLELGGQYRRALGAGFDLIAHAGIALPTASNDAGFFANGATQLYRITDLVLAYPETTTLRVGVSPVLHSGAMFARADLGVDIVLDHPDMLAGLPAADPDPLVHANLAVGARTGKLSGGLELATIGTTGDADGLGDRFIHTLALGARYDLGRFAPAIAVTTPLDASDRGDAFAVSGSVSARF